MILLNEDFHAIGKCFGFDVGRLRQGQHRGAQNPEEHSHGFNDNKMRDRFDRALKS
jgi:hypothetical protein